MVAFGHTSVGTIVGIASYQAFGKGDIALGLIATGFIGLISHYLMDFVPHGHFFTDPKKFEKLILWVILLDLLLPVLIVLATAHSIGKNATEILYILFGIGGAQLPDVIFGLKELKLLSENKLLKTEGDFHESTHWHGKREKALLWGWRDIWQIIMLILAFITLFKL